MRRQCRKTLRVNAVKERGEPLPPRASIAQEAVEVHGKILSAAARTRNHASSRLGGVDPTDATDTLLRREVVNEVPCPRVRVRERMAAGGGGRQKTMGSPSSRKVAIVPRFRITTPEQVSFHYATAGMASRYLAWLIDESIIWAIDAALVFALAPAGETGIALIILGVFAIDFSYFTFFELRGSGQTPGKRVFGLRVISARGSQLRPIDLLIRNLLRPVDMLPFAMLTGATIAAIDKWGRRLGDLAADTIVIRDYRKRSPWRSRMKNPA